MTAFALSVIIWLVMWGYGFMLIERKGLLSGMVAVACFLFPITIFTSPLEYVTENGGTVAQTTLALSTTTQSWLVLVDVFFLFVALLNLWKIVAESRESRRTEI